MIVLTNSNLLASIPFGTIYPSLLCIYLSTVCVCMNARHVVGSTH